MKYKVEVNMLSRGNKTFEVEAYSHREAYETVAKMLQRDNKPGVILSTERKGSPVRSAA